MKALTMAHDKTMRGRKLVVTFAHQAPLDQYGGAGTASLKNRKSMMETGRPTTLSMLKTGSGGRHEGYVLKLQNENLMNWNVSIEERWTKLP